MSSSIWTECAAASEVRALSSMTWRVVESQHQIATRKLVATDAEQQLLEELIESVKPPARTGGQLHYLLFTAFRYPPLRHGSRFGTRRERGIWYGSTTLPASFAEVAYYRLLFLEGTSAELGMVATDLTAFRILIRTTRGLDLTTSPFTKYIEVLASPTDYAATQALGASMREAGVQAFRYASARAPRGVNVGAFVSRVFGRRRPGQLEAWHCTTTRSRVEFTQRGYFERATHAFERDQFLVDGRLPSPAV